MLELTFTKFDFGWSSGPDPACGAYSTPQAPSGIWGGLLLREGKGKREGKDEKGRVPLLRSPFSSCMQLATRLAPTRLGDREGKREPLPREWSGSATGYIPSFRPIVRMLHSAFAHSDYFAAAADRIARKKNSRRASSATHLRESTLASTRSSQLRRLQWISWLSTRRAITPVCRAAFVHYERRIKERKWISVGELVL